ncbi:hypothetical protein [Cognatilysobacter bugurensis]|uniref:hypothetical protein n=1 Tax=Cognatilysobacter bugurensis TaxID=543356 RepID=UPI00167A8312|nr:hypothetical protein [Lysobacter bugurensis]
MAASTPDRRPVKMRTQMVTRRPAAFRAAATAVFGYDSGAKRRWMIRKIVHLCINLLLITIGAALSRRVFAALGAWRVRRVRLSDPPVPKPYSRTAGDSRLR